MAMKGKQTYGKLTRKISPVVKLKNLISIYQIGLKTIFKFRE